MKNFGVATIITTSVVVFALDLDHTFSSNVKVCVRKLFDNVLTWKMDLKGLSFPLLFNLITFQNVAKKEFDISVYFYFSISILFRMFISDHILKTFTMEVSFFLSPFNFLQHRWSLEMDLDLFYTLQDLTLPTYQVYNW